jgi:hypothetical protein
LRLLAGPPPTEWYWPRAVPAWRSRADRSGALREIAFSLAARQEAPAALPQWCATLVHAGHGAALVEALRGADLQVLARAAGIRFGESPQATSSADVADGASSSAKASSHSVAAEHGARQETEQASRLVAAMLRAGGDVAAARIFSRAEDVLPPEAKTAVGARSPRRADAPALQAAPDPRPQPWRTAAEPRGGAVESPASNIPRRAEQDAGAEAARPGPTPAATNAGGLLFLLNALLRVGYGDWFAGQPAWADHDVARQVLACVLTRLRVPDSDPAWQLVVSRSSSRARPRRFVAPARWREGLLSGAGPLRLGSRGHAGRLRDASGRLLLGAWEGPTPRALLADCRRAAPDARAPGRLEQEVVEAWLVALRRWLRRYARIGLADLVLRPARLTATPTHLDVDFELGTEDLRVRRAGLDLDPGWVPWFGRVTAFHYELAGRR